MLAGSYAGRDYVVVSSAPEAKEFGDWQLDIIDLSDFTIIDRIEGSADKWITSDDDRHLQGDLLLTDIALSEDGRYIFFHAGIETPIAEIYRYDIHTKSIDRLTDGDSHILDLLLFKDRWIAFRRSAPVPGTDRSTLGVWILDLVTGKSKLVQLGDNERPKLAGWTQAGYLVTYLDPLYSADHQAPRINAIEPATGENIPLSQPPIKENLISRIAEITPNDQLVIYDSIIRSPTEDIFPLRILEYDFNEGLDSDMNEMIEVYYEDEAPIHYIPGVRDSEGNYYLSRWLNPFKFSPGGDEQFFENEYGDQIYLSNSQEWLAFYNVSETNGRIGLRLYNTDTGLLWKTITDEPVYYLQDDPESKWLAYETDKGMFSYHIESGQTFPLIEGRLPEPYSNLEEHSLWVDR